MSKTQDNSIAIKANRKPRKIVNDKQTVKTKKQAFKELSSKYGDVFQDIRYDRKLNRKLIMA